ncbi:MAG: hypothetical protein HQL30_08280 [Candidatus Omnitrophica bacterium]|nr:hypothetical protein [Candidatus Omnitrophota bacterium]
MNKISRIFIAVIICSSQVTGISLGDNLAPELSLSDTEFRERFLAKEFMLSHHAVNIFIKEQIEKEKAFLGDGLWNKIKVKDLDIYNDPALRGNVLTRVEGLSNVKLVSVDGLLAHTGQFAHVGLSGKNYGGVPAIYIDSDFFDWNKIIIKHEIDEIIQWENLRANVLGLSREGMREWIKSRTRAPEPAISNEQCRRYGLPGLEGLNSIGIAKIIHNGSSSLDELFRFFDFDAASTYFNYDYISDMFRRYQHLAGEDVNIGAGADEGVLGIFRGINPEIDAAIKALFEKWSELDGKGTDDAGAGEKRRTFAEARTVLNARLMDAGRYTETYLDVTGGKFGLNVKNYRLVARYEYDIDGERVYVAHLRAMGGGHREDLKGANPVAAYVREEKLIKIKTDRIDAAAGEITRVLEGGLCFLTEKLDAAKRSYTAQYEALLTGILTQCFGGKEKPVIKDIVQKRTEIHEFKHAIDDLKGIAGKKYEEILRALPADYPSKEKRKLEKTVREVSAILYEISMGPSPKYALWESIVGHITHIIGNEWDYYDDACQKVLSEMFPDIVKSYTGKMAKRSDFILDCLKRIGSLGQEEIRLKAKTAYKKIFGHETSSLSSPVLVSKKEYVENITEEQRPPEQAAVDDVFAAMGADNKRVTEPRLPSVALAKEGTTPALRSLGEGGNHEPRSVTTLPPGRYSNDELYARFRKLSHEISDAVDDMLGKISAIEGKIIPSGSEREKARPVVESRMRLNELLIHKGYYVDAYSIPGENGFETYVYCYTILKYRVYAINGEKVRAINIRNIGERDAAEDKVGYSEASYDYEQKIIKIWTDNCKRTTVKTILNVLKGEAFYTFDAPSGAPGYREMMAMAHLSNEIVKETFSGRKFEELKALYRQRRGKERFIYGEKLLPDQELERDIAGIYALSVEDHEVKHRSDDIQGFIAELVQKVLPPGTEFEREIMGERLSKVMDETSAHLYNAAVGLLPKFTLSQLIGLHVDHILNGVHDQYDGATEQILLGLFPRASQGWKSGKMTKWQYLFFCMDGIKKMDENVLRKGVEAVYKQLFGCDIVDISSLNLEEEIEFPIPGEHLLGSPARFLNTVVEDHDIFDKAMSAEGFTVKELLPLRKTDDGVKKSSVYKEVEILLDLGVLVKTDGHNKNTNPAYRFSDSVSRGRDKKEIARLLNNLLGIEYRIGKTRNPLGRGDIPKDDNPLKSERVFVRELVRSSTDMETSASLADKVLAPVGRGAGNYYVIRYDKERLDEYARNAGIDGSSRFTPEFLIKRYVDLLRSKLGNAKNVKLIGSPAERDGKKCLISVMCYEGPGKTPEERIGEGHVDIGGDIDTGALRVAGMLNLALALSNIPEKGVKMTGIDKYSALKDFIKFQYRELTGEPCPEVLFKYPNSVIVLPAPVKMAVDKIEEYYKISVQQLYKAA